jgi:HK97 gp10 family phage protein
MDVEVNISGIAETARALYEFNERLGDKVTLLALRLGGNFMLKNIRNAEPKRTGRLKRATVLSKSKLNVRRRNGKVGLYVVVKRGKKRDDPKGAFYGKFVEHGHKSRNGSQVPAQKFIKNTFEQNKDRSRSIILQAIEDGGRQIVRSINSR